MLLQQTGKAKHTKKTEDQNGMYHITPLGIHISVFTNKMIIYELNCDTSTWQTKKKKRHIIGTIETKQISNTL